MFQNRNQKLWQIAAIALSLSITPALAVTSDNGSAILARVRAYHSELKDMSCSFSVEKDNNQVLSSISPDFAQFVKYGFKKFKYDYKAPDKVRIELNARFFHLLIKGISVRNGGQKNFYVPALHLHKTANVTGEANKKETSVDFGLIIGDVWQDYNVWYMRSEGSGSQKVYVLGLKPKNEPHGGTMIVRLDANTLRMVERDRYNGNGDVTQKQYFTDYVHPLPHVWLPTHIKLYNNKGQFAGELVYTNVSVNKGLSNQLFR